MVRHCGVLALALWTVLWCCGVSGASMPDAEAKRVPTASASQGSPVPFLTREQWLDLVFGRSGAQDDPSHWVAQLREADAKERRSAAIHLVDRASAGALGPYVADVTEAFASEQDKQIVRSLALVLQNMVSAGPGGGEALTAMANRLASAAGDYPLRAYLCRRFAYLGPKARPAAAALRDAAAGPDERVRVWAHAALMLVGEPEAAGLEVIRGAMQSDEASLVLAALDAAGLLGTMAEPLVPEMVSLLHGPYYAWAAATLSETGHVGPDGMREVAVLLGELEAGDADRGPLIELLGHVQEEKQEAVVLLLQVYDTSDARDRISALVSLGRLGAQEEGAMVRVRDAVASPDGFLRYAAAKAMAGVGKSRPQEAVLLLAELATDDDELVSLEALESLGTFGLEAAPTVPILRRLLRVEERGYVLAGVARCLGQIGEPAQAAAQDLADMAERADRMLMEKLTSEWLDAAEAAPQALAVLSGLTEGTEAGPDMPGPGD